MASSNKSLSIKLGKSKGDLNVTISVPKPNDTLTDAQILAAAKSILETTAIGDSEGAVDTVKDVAFITTTTEELAIL